MNRFSKAILPFADVLMLPAIYPAAYLLKLVRRAGVEKLPLCKGALMQVGVFPIRNHYYEPLFDGSMLRQPLNQERALPGIDWNVEKQLELLRQFRFNDELRVVQTEPLGTLKFDINNGVFEAGDAEFLYNMIRFKKPSRVFEIGSGNSTLIAMKAIRQNELEVPGYACKHVCIEPYEMPWLEETRVTVVRKRVEDVDPALFSELSSGDILFIDSSHMIRPQGDVLFEYLQLLPALKPGVIVHIHDIFSPRDYPKEWIVDEVRFWNEQYLLEGFLTCNKSWKIVAALNYLHHNYFERLQAACPLLTADKEPGSFYIERTSAD